MKRKQLPPERSLASRRQTAAPNPDRPAVQTPAAPKQGRPLPLSEEKLARIERRKARSRAAYLAIVVLLIMLATVVSIILVMRQSKPRPRFMFIQTGELLHKVACAGLVVRDEAVFNAPSDGILKPLTTEGGRVAKGQKLALIIPEGKEADLINLQKCEKDIIDLQNELMSHGKGAGAKAIFDESASSLAAIINLVRSDVSKGTLANLSAYESSLSVILEQRTAKLMDIDFDDARLTELKQTQQALEQALGLEAGTLVCQKPGIVSFKLDGQESALTPETVKTLTPDDFSRLAAGSQAILSGSPTVGLDKPVLRIISNLYQNLVLLLPDTDSTQLAIDALYTVSLPVDGLEIENCRLVRSEAAGRDVLVVFRTDRKVEWLADHRLIQAELTVSRTEGLKVPLAALIDFDEAARSASLMIVDGGFTRICKVEIMDYDRESAIIQALASETIKPAESTILVVNPASIEAGEFIGN